MKFSVVNKVVQKYPRFRTTGKTVYFKINPVPEGEEPVGWVLTALRELILFSTSELEPTDIVGFTFSSKDFTRGRGWMPFKEASKISVEEILELIQGVYQSNSCGLQTGTFQLGVTSIRLPHGSGRPSTSKFTTFREECRGRRGIVVIQNSDNLCLPRALVVAMAFVSSRVTFGKIRDDRNKLQKIKALELCQSVGVAVPATGCGLKQIKQFQEYLKEYKITVYEYGSKGRDVLFEGEGQGKRLNLLFYEGHFNVITNITGAFVCHFFCETCHVPFDHKNRHKCVKICHLCKQAPPCERENKTKCEDCFRDFVSQKCFQQHKEAGAFFTKSVCDEIKSCPLCRVGFRSSREHTCGEIFCNTCKSFKESGHYCFMQVDTKTPKQDGTLFIFFDLETRQEKLLEDGSFLHEPNLCVFKTACDSCIGTGNTTFCYKCGPNLVVLREKPIETFLKTVLTKRDSFKKVIVISHFGSGFDMQFILNLLLQQTDLTPEVILRGTKILLMTLGNVKFLDSLNFMPMSLAKLPQSFDLSKNLKKGYFPHFFNKKENENYIGPLPSLEYYDPDSMMEDDRNSFLKWYEENKTQEFNFQRDIVAYCISDVEILSEACLKFRELMLTTSNVCPFSESCTIPGACNKIFRRNYLKPNSIGIIPKNGYRWRDNQSRSAIKWLIWEEHQRGINIEHAAKRGEAVIKGFKVDGFCQDLKQIFEFQGCFWHGCPKCYKNNRDQPIKKAVEGDSFESRYESTVYKINNLKEEGFEVIEKWECDFARELKLNKSMNEFIEKQPLLAHTPLIARDAFYGGRTGNTRTYYKAVEGEQIKYLDVCSLYPWVCKYGKFPVGHPEVFAGQECKTLDLNKTDGLIKCRVLPPQDLFHPVLPQKMNNKLMFVLCRLCGGEMGKGVVCTHSDSERALTGTWVISEVNKAIEKGYRILEIFEIWRYQVEQYNTETKEGGLFVNMMNRFLQIKQEASGFPSSCQNEGDKTNYIQNFWEKEGIQLEAGKIESNSGLRSLAKLILNSFWGKFGELERKCQTKIVKDPQTYFNILTNPLLEITDVLPVNENVFLIGFVEKEDSYEPLPTVNVAIAAFVTAQARLKLYSYLENLGERALYYDTDSIIYSFKEGEYDLPSGNLIGDLTDELEGFGPGSYITEFASGGPKNYTFSVFSTKEQKNEVVCKVKGIRLCYSASRLVNFDSIKDMILNSIEVTPISIISSNIRRTDTHEVVTRKEEKRYKVNSTKRNFFPDGSSVPFGYNKKLKK